MPLPFDNYALRESIKKKIEHWIDKYGMIPVMQQFKAICDERKSIVAFSSAGSSAGWSSASTSCNTFIGDIVVGPTAF